ncbi:hypothetical protein MRX96_032222 [Rhipicephalus microplus]
MCRCKCTELALAGGAGRACGDEPNPIDRSTMRSGSVCHGAGQVADQVCYAIERTLRGKVRATKPISVTRTLARRAVETGWLRRD